MKHSRYFLSLASHPDTETEVTMSEYVEAERAAGFHPKTGCGPTATASFTSTGVRGRVLYPPVTPLAQVGGAA